MNAIPVHNMTIPDSRIVVIDLQDNQTNVAQDVEAGVAILNTMGAGSVGRDLALMLSMVRRMVMFIDKMINEPTLPTIHGVMKDGSHFIAVLPELYSETVPIDERNNTIKDFFLANDVIAYVMFAEAFIVTEHHPAQDDDDPKHTVVERNLDSAQRSSAKDVALFRSESGDYACMLAFEIETHGEDDRTMHGDHPVVGMRVRKSADQAHSMDFLLENRPVLN